MQAMVRSGDYVVTGVAFNGALKLALDAGVDIEACVLALDESDFYKTMPSIKVPGLMQDVYKPTYGGHRLYVKLQIGKSGTAVVIQFKGDESR
jgi:hypothetical protein